MSKNNLAQITPEHLVSKPTNAEKSLNLYTWNYTISGLKPVLKHLIYDFPVLT
jgi:hypothetical protein